MGLLCLCHGCLERAEEQLSSKGFFLGERRDRVVAVENTQESLEQRFGGGREEGRERALTVPRGPVTISRVCSVHREGWGGGSHRTLLIGRPWRRAGGATGSDLSPMRQLLGRAN